MGGEGITPLQPSPSYDSNEPAGASAPRSSYVACFRTPTRAPVPHPHAQTGSPDNIQHRLHAAKAPHPATLPSQLPAPEGRSRALPYAGYAPPLQSAESSAAEQHSSP